MTPLRGVLENFLTNESYLLHVSLIQNYIVFFAMQLFLANLGIET